MTMGNPSSPPGRTQYTLNLALASVAGLGGCVTVAILLAALLLGLWLDGVLKTKPLFTLVLVIGSAPVGLFAMYRVAMSAVARIKPAPTSSAAPSKQEENDRD